jgi:hypothetical protein
VHAMVDRPGAASPVRDILFDAGRVTR